MKIGTSLPCRDHPFPRQSQTWKHMQCMHSKKAGCSMKHYTLYITCKNRQNSFQIHVYIIHDNTRSLAYSATTWVPPPRFTMSSNHSVFIYYRFTISLRPGSGHYHLFVNWSRANISNIVSLNY